MRTLVWLIALSAACKSGGLPDDAKTTVLSFPDLDCSSCGEEMARDLIEEDGVYKTSFDVRRAELTVVAASSIDALALAQANKPADEEWHLVRGAGKGAYLPWKKAPAGADVKEIATDGQDVPSLEKHLVPGKVTLFDFSAKWCEPCRALDEHVLALISKRDDVAYRKLDVGDWDTPLGERYLEGITKLPYVIIYDKQGRRVKAITGLDLDGIDRAIDEAAAAR